MKINWKVLFALVLVVGAVYWAFSSTQVNSYSGTNLTFAVGGGPVTMTNPSDEAISVQLIGTGSRSFSVSSTIDDVSGPQPGRVPEVTEPMCSRLSCHRASAPLRLHVVKM
jgi:hypothetical protein